MNKNLNENYVKFTLEETEENLEHLMEIKLNLNYLKNICPDCSNLTKDSFLPDKYLTNRELEVLNYLSSGKNNKQIAELMHVSIHTVKVHIHNIFTKFSVDDRIKAVVKGYKAGLIKL